jgi:erythromycin esterase-like protein
MAETLIALDAHLSEQTDAAKIVVWAHNSHLGDAAATDMGERGEWNVGQLIREKYGREIVRLIGFTTYEGTVSAATNWDEPAQTKRVRPGLKDSVENLFHQTGVPNFFLNVRDEQIRGELQKPMLERAIGVVYRPETERVSHYFYANPAEQFDGLIHFDQTSAVVPLERAASETHEDVPETFPTGI